MIETAIMLFDYAPSHRNEILIQPEFVHIEGII